MIFGYGLTAGGKGVSDSVDSSQSIVNLNHIVLVQLRVITIQEYIKEKNIPLLYETADCESISFKPEVLSGEQRGDGGKAGFVMQFHRPTFDWFKKLSGMSELVYENNYDQVDLAAWAFQNGFAYDHWTCYRLRGGKR